MQPTTTSNRPPPPPEVIEACARFLVDARVPITFTRSQELSGQDARGNELEPYKIASVESAVVPNFGSVAEATRALTDTLTGYGGTKTPRNIVGAVGLAFEHETSVCFVDLDGPEAVKAFMALGAPKTFTVKSARGYHLWYFAPPDCSKPKIEFGEAGGIKLSSKGYGLLPGSWHAGSEVYYTVQADRPVVMLPQETYDEIVRQSGVSKDKAKHRLASRGISVSEDGTVEGGGRKIPAGERDNTIVQYVGYMNSVGMPEDAALAAAQALALNWCELRPTEDPDTLKRYAYEILPMKVSRWYRKEWDAVEVLDEWIRPDIAPAPRKISRPPSLTEDGLADHFRRVHGEHFRYWLESASWMFFYEGRWQRQGLHAARQAYEKMHRGLYDEYGASLPDGNEFKEALEKFSNVRAIRAQRDNVLNIAESRLLVTTNELDQHPRLLAVGNGTLDLRPGVYMLKDGEPHDLLTVGSSVKYVPGAPCPKWHRFLEEISCGDSEWVSYLQRFAGYILTGEVDDEQFYIWLGQRGGNGKDTTANVFRNVLGRDLAKEMSFSTIAAVKAKRSGSEASSDLMALMGTRFIKTTEPARGQEVNEALLKQMTGKTYISARELHSKQTQFRLQGKIVVPTNHPPTLDVTDLGLRRRIVVVPWNAHFKAGENRNLKMEEELREESEGILAWMVEGLKSYDAMEFGLDPSSCQAVAIATADFLENSNLLSGAVESDHILLDPDAVSSSGELLEAIEQLFNPASWMGEELPEYVREYRGEPISRDKITDALIALGCVKKRTKKGVFWHGVRMPGSKV